MIPALFCSACSVGAIERLPFPADGELMVLATKSGEDVSVEVFDLDTPAIRLSRAFEDAATLTAAVYAVRPPGLSPGRLAPIAPPRDPLPPGAYFTAELREGRLDGWTEQSDRPAVLEPYGTPHAERCPQLENQPVRRTASDHFPITVALDDGTALIGANDELMRIDVEGVIVETATLADVRTAARGPSGAVIATRDALLRVELGPLRFEPIVDFPADDYLRWIDVGESMQIAMLSNRGDVHLFDGTKVEHLAQLELPGFTFSKGGVLWLGPGQVAASAGVINSIWRWDGAAANQDVPESVEFSFGTALASRLGPLVTGSTTGEVYAYRGPGRWETLDIGLIPQVQVLADYDGGLFYADDSGRIGWADGEVECPMSFEGIREIWAAAPLGDGLIIAGPTFAGELTFELLHP